MKTFHYDTLLSEEDICNLSEERKVVERAIEAGKKLVIYGPRNFGKTSLIKNVVLPWFKKRNKNSFVFFADLMEVKNLESIDRRILKGFEMSFGDSFPVKHFVENVKTFLTNLRPQISIDPSSGKPSLSIVPHSSEKMISFEEIFKTISTIAKDRPTVIVLDEFQDIAFVDEAQGLFRKIFQELSGIPLVVMGSKRHILANILAKQDAPLSMFGEDLEFKPISYEEYHAYILERFETLDIGMSMEDSKYLQNVLLRVPEAINIICAEIMDAYGSKEVGRKEIDASICSAVEKRRSRYEEYLSHFSNNEESVLISLAKEGAVKQPNSRAFLQTVKPTSRMVGIIIRQFMNKSVIDKKEEGYYISDPLLVFYLKHYR